MQIYKYKQHLLSLSIMFYFIMNAFDGFQVTRVFIAVFAIFRLEPGKQLPQYVGTSQHNTNWYKGKLPDHTVQP